MQAAALQITSVSNYKQHAYAIPRGATDDLEMDKRSSEIITR